MLTPEQVNRLVAIVRLFESEHDGERLAALEKAQNILRQEKMTFADIVVMAHNQAGNSVGRAFASERPNFTDIFSNMWQPPASGPSAPGADGPGKPVLYGREIPVVVSGTMSILHKYEGRPSTHAKGASKPFTDIQVEGKDYIYSGIRIFNDKISAQDVEDLDGFKVELEVIHNNKPGSTHFPPVGTFI